MHAVIEFLPILFGIALAFLFRFTKGFFSKSATFIILNIIVGAFVNWLSKEGIQFLMVDVALTCVSCYGIIATQYIIKKA